MLLDNLSRFVDGAVPATTAAATSSIEMSNYAGRNEPVNILAEWRGTGNSAALTLTIEFQESADNATFTAVDSWTLAKPAATEVVEFYQVPPTTTKKYVRLSVKSSAAGTGTTFSAGLVRERFLPYSKGQYIDGGKVIG
jgi:hypothetical protein